MSQGGAYGIPLIQFPVAEEIVTTGLEVIDLQTGNVIAERELTSSEDTLVGGQVLFAPDGARLYVFTTDKRFEASLTVVGFAGGQLQVLARVTNGQDGHQLPTASFIDRLPSDFKLVGTTLLRFDPASRVRVFDLSTLSIRADLDIGADRVGSKPCSPAALYSPDGTRLYVANAEVGTVRVVDLVLGALTTTMTLPGSTTTVGTRPMRVIGPGTVALASDGTRLYLTDGRTGAGLVIMDTAGLQLIGRWLPEQPVRAVWPGPDGQIVFTVVQDQVVAFLRTDGSIAGALDLGTLVIGFVTAG